MKLSCPIAIALLVVAVGCRRQDNLPDDPVSKVGLTETALGHPLIEQASAYANSWLDPALNTRFAPSWAAPDPHSQSDSVKIYAISEFHAPANYMVAVPVGCRCVFIEPRVYESWLKDHTPSSGATLEVDPQRLLGFMLLHEAGHIVHHDPGDFGEGVQGTLNLDPTEQKDREQKADAFAVEQLEGAIGRRKQLEPWLAALNTTKDLENLSFEMQEVRQKKYFGAVTLHTPAAYYDTSYTHPNFELRILTVNDLVSNTPNSHKLLTDFLEGRISNATPSVLFQAPSLTQ